MSARNRPAAKTARRDERQQRSASTAAAGRHKARIAQAVHQAVCDVTASDGFGHCALYMLIREQPPGPVKETVLLALELLGQPPRRIA